MYILDVIPLVLIPRNQGQVLSYFSTDPVGKFALVEVNLNHRKIQGVVVGCDPIKSRKLDFKKGVDFELKPISKILKPEPQIADWQYQIASWVSEKYFAPLGLTLRIILPPFFGKKKNVLPEVRHDASGNSQIFHLVAENTAGRYFMEKLADKKPIYINSAVKMSDYAETWKKVVSGEAKYIIGTRVGLFLPFSNLKKIIIDDEFSEAYKSDMSPRYHAVEVARFIAKTRGAEIVFPEKTATKTKTTTISMIDEIRSGNFSLFSRDIKEIFYKMPVEKGHVILFVPRRGHANFISCTHCGQSIKCPNCEVSLVLHSEPNEYLFCHHCDHREPKPKQCPYCKSYTLKAVGIGIEKVIAELKKYFKYQNLETPPILRLDSDIAETEAAEEKIVGDFESSENAILVSTHVLFSHKHRLDGLRPKPKICIISTDTLINIPDFKTEELLFWQIDTLRSLSSELIILTHNPGNPAIRFGADGNKNAFMEQELENRKMFNYPPFCELTKITFRHLNDERARRESRIASEKLRTEMKYLKLDPREFRLLGPYPAFISKEKSLYAWSFLLKSPTDKIKTRNEILRVVPAAKGWVVDVNPRSAI